MARKAANKYSFKTHGKPEFGTGFPGNHITNRSLAQLTSPYWSDEGNSVTVIRIMPPLADEGSDEFWGPARTGPEDDDLGDFIRSYHTARKIGANNQVSFILYNPVTDPDYDIDQNPVVLLQRNLAWAINNGKERSGWAKLEKGGKGRGPAIKKPGKSFFVQCMVYQRGTKIYDPPVGGDKDGVIQVMDLGISAGMAVLDLLRERHDDGSFVLEDPVSFKKKCGKFFTIYRSGQDPRPRDAEPSRRAKPGEKRSERSRDDGEKNRFEAFTSQKFDGEFASLLDWEPMMRDRVQPWEDVLQFPSDEEQAKLLASANRFPFDLIEMAFADHPEWIPSRDSDEARAGRGATSGRSGWTDDDEEEEDDDDDRSHRGSRRRGSAAVAEDDEEEDDRPARRSKHVDDEEDEKEDRPPRRKRDAAAPKSRIPDDEEEEETRPAKSGRRAPPREEEEEEDDEPAAKPSRKAPPRDEEEEEEEDDRPPRRKPPVADDEEEEDERPVRRRPPAAKAAVEEEDEEEEESRPPRRRKPAAKADEEEDDVAATRRAGRDARKR